MTTEPLHPTRRTALAGLAGLAGGLVLGRPALAEIDEAAARKLKPGQYNWQPELQPSGPVSIIVSVKEQLLHVHRRGVRIAVSTVSTGKPGHDTPTGVFTILEKDKDHVSSIYDAEMPFMERLTWSGIALHAGNLPGYPASHGCVRMPLKFAELLYGVTKIGTPVVVATDFTTTQSVQNPNVAGTFYSAKNISGFSARERAYQAGEPEERPVTSVLVSRRDHQVMVLENGTIVAEGQATIDDPDKPFPSEVFVLSGAGEGGEGLSWDAIGYGEGGEEAVTVPDSATMDRIHGPANVAAAIRERLAPGMILLITDQPLSADTRSDTDFVVMTTDGEDK